MRFGKMKQTSREPWCSWPIETKPETHCLKFDNLLWKQLWSLVRIPYPKNMPRTIQRYLSGFVSKLNIVDSRFTDNLPIFGLIVISQWRAAKLLQKFELYLTSWLSNVNQSRSPLVFTSYWRRSAQKTTSFQKTGTKFKDFVLNSQLFLAFYEISRSDKMSRVLYGYKKCHFSQLKSDR
jgi:hypothetical protein